jgi:glutathione S-transferase
MLRLHGFASSNYYNVVKLVLMEKGLEFEEVTSYPPADRAYKSKNPTGKYPCLETQDGCFLGESKVILNYLEEAYPGVPLLPADPLGRARVRELMEIVDLYLELPARRLYPEALFDGKVGGEVKDTVRTELLGLGTAPHGQWETAPSSRLAARRRRWRRQLDSETRRTVLVDAEVDPPRLYGELAAWWPLLSAPTDYAEEAAFHQHRLLFGHPPTMAATTA